MNKIEAIIRLERLSAVVSAVTSEGFSGLNVVNVTGRGEQQWTVQTGSRPGEIQVVDMLPRAKVELVVKDEDTQKVVDVIMEAARTGREGDGKIFVLPVANAFRVRTGEKGEKVI